jgi:hypothetical protein
MMIMSFNHPTLDFDLGGLVLSTNTGKTLYGGVFESIEETHLRKLQDAVKVAQYYPPGKWDIETVTARNEVLYFWKTYYTQENLQKEVFLVTQEDIHIAQQFVEDQILTPIGGNKFMWSKKYQ